MTPIAWVLAVVAVAAVGLHLYGLHVFKKTKGEDDNPPSVRERDFIRDYKIVGTRTFQGELNGNEKVTLTYSLHMDDDGHRLATITPRRFEDDPFFKNGRDSKWVAAKTWEIGGPFPDGFDYPKDPLTEMLDRMVNQSLTGIPDKDRHKQIEDKSDE